MRIRAAAALAGTMLAASLTVTGAAAGTSASTPPDTTAEADSAVASTQADSSVVATTPTGDATLGELRFVGEIDVPNLTVVGGTLVGGLSGIDYDPTTGSWLVISDDRSDANPARFYDATLTYDDEGLSDVVLVAQHPLLQENGATYPSAQVGGVVPDPEAIRVDPDDGSLWWTSEGNQELGLDPLLIHANPRGVALATHVVPDSFGANPEEDALGARNNKAFEGLTFAADGQSLYAIMEGPLYQDAELPTLESGSVSRIVQFDREGNVLGQYAYPLDALPAAGEGELADLADNGATEILAVSDTTMLVLERAGIPQDGAPWELLVRLYEIDLSAATDVSELEALAGADYTPVSKTLVLDFEQSGLDHIDNLEALAFGPPLASGNRSLVVVSDNNFDPASVTQFLLYEVAPAS